MKNNNTSINQIRPKKDLCIKGLWIEIILACAFILSSILICLLRSNYISADCKFSVKNITIFTCVVFFAKKCELIDKNQW